MFKHNNFNKDDHFEHLTRVEDCAKGLAIYGDELGILPSLVDEVKEYALNYALILKARHIEEDEWHAAVVEYETIRDELTDSISDARWMVKSILENPNFSESTKNLLRDHFELEEKLTLKYETLRNVGESILEGQEKLIELASEWVLPAGLITRIETNLEDFIASRDSSKKEKIEKQNAVDVLYEARENGHRLLRKVYRWAIAVWGNDDEKLFALGFVPKSAIWTPGDDEVEWDDVPTGVNLRIIDLITNQFISIDADKYKGNTGFDVRVAWGETGGNIPKMPKDDTFTNAPFAIAYTDDYKPGMTFYAWVRARKDDEVTDWADVVSLDIPSA